MILVDANLLLYARSREAPQHIQARTWLDAQLSGRSLVGLPWESLLAFVRLISNPRVYARPEPIATAWSQVEHWLSAPPAWIPLPTDRHFDVLAQLLPAVDRPELVPDAHLAALAL